LIHTKDSSSKDPTIMRLHKRSKSHCAPNKARQSLTKQGFDASAFAITQENNDNTTFDKKLVL